MTVLFENRQIKGFTALFCTILSFSPSLFLALSRSKGKPVTLGSFLNKCMARDSQVREQYLTECSLDGHGRYPDYIFETAHQGNPVINRSKSYLGPLGLYSQPLAIITFDLNQIH